MLGNLLQKKLAEYGVSQEEIVRRIKKRRPSYKIDRPRITRYCSGATELKREVLNDLFVYGLGMSPDQASSAISDYILQEESKLVSSSRLHQIFIKDSEVDGLVGKAYSKLPVFKSLRDAHMEKGEIIGHHPKPYGVEFEDSRLYWAPVDEGGKKLALVLRDPQDLLHGKPYVFKINDQYQISRYEMPIDRKKTEPVGAVVGFFEYT